MLLCALALPISAVINTKTETKIERREAPLEHKPFDTYGLPPVVHSGLPTAVYGAPAVAKYPSLPPERPPAPSPEYGELSIPECDETLKLFRKKKFH